MRFIEMGFAFAVIGFVAVNAVLSALTALLWSWMRRLQLRADALFLLRMLPALGSAAFVLGVIVPAYLSFEPRQTSERAGPALVVVALVASALLAAGIWRALSGWLDTRRMERAWRSVSVPTTTPSMPVRVFRVRTLMPLAALVGVFRPRLFVSEQFLDSLAENERQAVLDHEAAHLAARDNLKRTAVKLAPDWLSFTAAGSEIESAWTIATEEEADDRAAGPDGARSLDVASALIKAARLAPAHCPSVSSFCEESSIVRRVARLLDDRLVRRESPSRRIPVMLLALAVLASAVWLAGPQGLRVVYTLSEATVKIFNYGAW
jgi:hypothetical protein